MKRHPNNKLVQHGPPALYMDKNGYIYMAIVKTNRFTGRNSVEYYNLNRPAPPYKPNSLKQFFKPASPKRKSPPKRKNSPKRKSPSPPKMNKFVMPNFPGL